MIDRNGRSFPDKLRGMLEDAIDQGLEDVISWEITGTAFRVHKPKEFVERIMPRWFNQTKFKSFQRQLNLYGFSRITRGHHKGCYLHDCFRRGRPEDSRVITRKKAHEDSHEIDLSPSWLPNNMSVEPTPIPNSAQRSPLLPAALNNTSVVMTPFEAFFQSQVARLNNQSNDDDCCDTKKHGNPLQRMLDSMMMEEPTASPETNTTPKATAVPAGAVGKKYQRTAVFPDKLHDMLEYCEENNLDHIASWVMNGRAFKVHKVDAFMKQVMHRFFKQSKFESLQRQLNLYGFSRVPKGPLKGCYYHNLFIKGGRSLSCGMSRRRQEDSESTHIVPTPPVSQQCMLPRGLARPASQLPCQLPWSTLSPSIPPMAGSASSGSVNLPWAAPSLSNINPHNLSMIEPDPLASNEERQEELPQDDFERMIMNQASKEQAQQEAPLPIQYTNVRLSGSGAALIQW